MLLLAANNAFAQLANVSSTLTNIQGVLTGLSIVVVTLAVLYVGYKILFGGSTFKELAPVIIGALIIGGGAQIATLLVGN
jgi:type IV secretion system protein VirB2